MSLRHIIGKNNIIQKTVKIMDNVIIGNNNKIYDGTIIYPNTIIGNNNVILNNNIIGEHPISASEDTKTFDNKKFNGVTIGNNNFFHIDNKIFGGYEDKTKIGNNNKILAESHIGHDTNITDNVIIYPRCITGGYSILLPNSVMGFYSTIQQRMTLGNYAMIGAGNNVSHNIFPYYIMVNNKYLRLNVHAIPDNFNINKYDNILRDIIQDIKDNNNYNFNTLKNIYDLPTNIRNIIYIFLNKLKIYKL